MKIKSRLFLCTAALLLVFGCQESAAPLGIQNELEESSAIGGQNTNDGDDVAPPAIVAGLDSGTASIADVVTENSATPQRRMDLLAPGSKAPAIDLAAVVHGPEVRPFTGDHVIVVEFWATWCDPCIRNMPHISALQQQYGREVQFIGVTDEDEDTVMEFMQREVKDGENWGDLLAYSIALDRDGQTWANFMDAAEQNRIPCAFVINKQGNVAWIGPPAGIDGPLAEIVAGEWDMDAARELFLATSKPREVPHRPAPDELTLQPGMPAPAVRLASVVHGKSFNGEFVEGRTYVVQFWATWCRPCLDSMRRLTILQEKYGNDVQIVAVTAEALETVIEFLGRNTIVLKFSIAVDDGRTTRSSYMRAAGQKRIPCAFIINQNGRVAWIGHPTQIELPLAQVVDGSFQIEQAAELFRAERKLRSTVENRDFDGVLDQLSELSMSQPDSLRFQIMGLQLSSQLGKRAEYNETAAATVDSHPDQFELMNAIAWEIADKQSGDGRDLDLAMKAAILASEVTHHSSPNILDTVARVFYEQGDVEQAVAWQEKAVSAAPRRRGNRNLRALLQKNLRLFRSKLPVAAAESANDEARVEDPSSAGE